MTTPSPTPADLMSISACVRALKSEGTKISVAGLSKYIRQGRAHLVHGVKGRSKMVSLSEIRDARDDFTRELMAGEHVKSKSPDKPRAPSKPSAVQSGAAEASRPKTPNLKLAAANPDADAPDDLSEIRSLRAQSEAQKLERQTLETAKYKSEITTVDEVNAAAAAVMKCVKDSLLGPNLSRNTERVMSVLGLPETKKRQTQAILRDIFGDAIGAMRSGFETELSQINAADPGGLPDTLEQLTVYAETLRSSQSGRVTA